jgi:LysR family glycine cleavage system transcriptional activator
MKRNFLQQSARPRISLPPLSALEAFDRAAAHLSFLRAAKELGITPSAVSHRIRSLEQKCGVRLFARAGRAVKLTQAGEKYLKNVRAALEALGQASRNLQSQDGGIPDIRISALPFFTSAVLLPALGDFRKRFPHARLHIEATNDYADFDRAGVDAAIRYGRERPAGLRFDPLTEISIVPVCTPEIARRMRSPEDISRQPLIHLTVQPAAWPQWLTQAGLGEPSSRMDLWFDNVLTALDAAEGGHGVVLAMYPLIKTRKGFGRSLVIPFNLPSQKGGVFHLAYRSEDARTKRIVVLRRWLIDAVKNITHNVR